MRKGWIPITLLSFVVIGAVVGYYIYSLSSSTKADLDERWSAYDDSSVVSVDNELWQGILDDYLVTDTDSGVNLFDYEGLLDDGREPLDDYLAQMVALDPLTLNRAEQKSYWINLYNALTVQLIIDNYPLASITTLGSNPVDFGPWNDEATVVNGIPLSLNAIEHQIIRPLYDDYRIHFAVNCASIGCPDLAETAFNAEQIDSQLDEAAAKYLGHPRGLHFEGETLHLSTLFEWYASDFGDTLQEVLQSLGKHTDEGIVASLSQYKGSPTYDYDWSLNGYCSEEGSCGEKK